MTNCVGNFFVTPDAVDPAFPVLAGVQKGKIGPMPMTTQISRATSCAECHALPILEPPTQAEPPVYLAVSNTPEEVKDCPANPNAAGDGGSL